ECKQLTKAGVSSLALTIEDPSAEWKEQCLTAVEDIRKANKHLNIVLHSDSVFTQAELKQLLRSKVSKVQVEASDISLHDKFLFENKLHRLKSIGKANNRLKIATMGYKTARFILRAI
ncbi:MAG: hypothetical protein R3Y07_00280, partial [Eubacteriales bacterium]